MKIPEFRVLVAKDEAGSIETSIAQISEILKVVNKRLDGALYREIRKLKSRKSCKKK